MLSRSTLIRAMSVGATLAVLLLSTAKAQTLNAETRAQLQKACADDTQRLCPGIQPGGGRLYKCLQQQPDQVSQTCKGAMKSFLQGR